MNWAASKGDNKPEILNAKSIAPTRILNLVEFNTMGDSFQSTKTFVKTFELDALINTMDAQNCIAKWQGLNKCELEKGKFIHGREMSG